jgi:hypothetical protein
MTDIGGYISSNIDNTKFSQDLELANALQGLTPIERQNYSDTIKNRLLITIKSQHSDNFKRAYSDAVNNANTVKNVFYYYKRNQDLNDIQSSLLSNARKETDNAVYDTQTSKRQFEINEWTANNKMDTLFVLQLVFIGLTILVPLLYLNRVGLVPYSAFYGISFIVLAAIILTLIVRLTYTWKTRDLRYWNRRRFAKQGGPPVPPTCADVQASLTGALNTVTGQTTMTNNPAPAPGAAAAPTSGSGPAAVAS